ncbi:hypothetical protein [Erythrobacter crassostreae]|uniref:Polyketide cyclase / dehydrase and lipid transport n=1 Tax=Erythrobacter crassostreae TaxID=2828328 RepID=A0A9X1F3P0_9SPHN|nr:hypothetical protein [Erythrobacter crassostrea]MBV7259695.1 hypothetical protein [Erythrobacter crassostrea]
MYAPPTPPNTAGSGFLLGMLATMLGAFAYLVYGPGIDEGYAGFGVLFAIPFALGALVGGLGWASYNTVGCILAPIVLFAILFPLVYFGVGEGLVCIMMVLPFWLVGGIGGALAGLIIKIRREEAEREAASGTRLKISAALTLPFALIYAEEMSPPEWQERSVTRTVTIAASAEEVWPMLVAIPDIAGDEGKATFTHDVIGIPRPSDAALVERESGLVREAEWGPNIRFEEHVDEIVEGERIAWSFVFPDESVQAHTDKHINPDGPVVKIARGGYTLSDTGNGEVELTLTTQYQMRTRLGWYFGLWGEVLLGDVHDNVLEVIKVRAEAG